MRAGQTFFSRAARGFLAITAVLGTLSVGTAQAAISEVSSGSFGGSAPSATVSQSITVGAGADMLIVMTSSELGGLTGDAMTVTYGGVSMNLAVGNRTHSAIWYLDLATPGISGTTVVVDMAGYGTRNGFAAGWVSIDGNLGAGDSIALHSTGTSAAQANTVDLVTTEETFNVVNFNGNGTSGTVTVNSPNPTVIYTDNNIGSARSAAAYKELVAAGTSTYQWTLTGGSLPSDYRRIDAAAFEVVVVPDTTPPELAAVNPLNPSDDASNVPISANLVATFNEDIALKAGGTITITDLTDGSSTVIIGLLDADQVSVSGADLTINPTLDLEPLTHYSVQISDDAIEDTASSPNAFAGILDDATWNFTTAAPDLTAPVLTGQDPTPGATAVSHSPTITATFDDALLLGSGNITIYNVTLGATDQTIAVTDGSQVSLAGSVLTINPASTLDLNTEYAVRMDAGVVKNSSDVVFAGIADNSWSFTTEEVPTYTWIHGGDVQDWTDPANWQDGSVPPWYETNARIIFDPATSGSISSLPSVSDNNRVTVGSVFWSSSFDMSDFGSWNDVNKGWIIDTGSADPAHPATFTFSNGAFMSNRYGTWKLNSYLLLSGTGAGGGLQVHAGNGYAVGAGGFIVESGTLKFKKTHTGTDHPYTGGVIIRNVGVVQVQDGSNEALGEGLVTVEEGGQLQALSSTLDNDVTIVLTESGATPPSNTTLITGSPVLSGALSFDVSDVVLTQDDQWQIVNVDTTYAGGFSVAGFSEIAAGVWVRMMDGGRYKFDEATGILSGDRITLFMFK